MKKILLVSFLTFTITLLLSQTGFSVYPAEGTLEIENPDEAEYVLHGMVVNTRDTEIKLRWVKEILSKPEVSAAAICDNVACYDPSKESSEFVIAAGDTSNFDFHYYPNGNAGNAVAKIQVYEVANQSNKGEMAVTVNRASTGSYVAQNSEDVRVFPNPATDYFSVDGVNNLKEVIIINLVGQEVKRFPASLKAKYNVSDLYRGMYLIRLIDQKEKVIKTVRLSKR